MAKRWRTESISTHDARHLTHIGDLKPLTRFLFCCRCHWHVYVVGYGERRFRVKSAEIRKHFGFAHTRQTEKPGNNTTIRAKITWFDTLHVHIQHFDLMLFAVQRVGCENGFSLEEAPLWARTRRTGDFHEPKDKRFSAIIHLLCASEFVLCVCVCASQLARNGWDMPSVDYVISGLSKHFPALARIAFNSSETETGSKTKCVNISINFTGDFNYAHPFAAVCVLSLRHSSIQSRIARTTSDYTMSAGAMVMFIYLSSKYYSAEKNTLRTKQIKIAHTSIRNDINIKWIHPCHVHTLAQS